MSSDQSEILQHIGEGALKYTSEHSFSCIFTSTHQHSKKGVKMYTANSELQKRKNQTIQTLFIVSFITITILICW